MNRRVYFDSTWMVTVRLPGYENQISVDIALLNQLQTLIEENFEEYPHIPVMELATYRDQPCLLITTGSYYLKLIKQMDFYFPESLARVIDTNLAFTTNKIFSFRKID